MEIFIGLSKAFGWEALAFLSLWRPWPVKQLPKHHPFDINIDIGGGKELPFSPIYPLTEYTQEHLTKGYTRCSTSSASSPSPDSSWKTLLEDRTID